MRVIVHYLRNRLALLPVFEGLVLVTSMVLGFSIRLPQVDRIEAGMHGVVFAAAMLLAMTGLGLYDQKSESFRITAQKVFSAYLVTLSLFAVLFYLFPESSIGRGVFAIASIFALFGVLFVRYAAYRAVALEVPTTRVLVVGDGPEADEVAELLRVRKGGRAARLAAQVSISPVGNVERPGGAADIDALPSIVRHRRISEVVVALHDRRNGREPLAALLACKLMGVNIVDLATFYERELGLIRLEYLRSSWLVYGTGFDQGVLRALVKRSFDLSVSTVLLLLSAPILALTALAIRLESDGPILYRQERVRDGGVPFMMLKFRSMRPDAEGDGVPRWASAADERITRVGRIIRRLRIDELPQLLNVFMGDMSFVGPRPERPYFVAQLAAEVPYYELRHNVKPGITGWAQVRLQYTASVEDAKRKLQYDLYYVKNHSLFLDLMILFETIQVVMLGKGAR